MGRALHGTLCGFRNLSDSRWARNIQLALWTACCLLWVCSAITSEPQRKMWTDAEMECRKTNQTLPQTYLKNSSKERINLIGSRGPLWLMGFEEYVYNNSHWFAIMYIDASETAHVMCGFDIKQSSSYATAISDRCSLDRLLNVTPYDISKMSRSPDYLNSNFWLNAVNPGEFMNADGTGVQILCYILTETGEIQTDNCTNSHPFECVNGSLAPVVRYLGNKTSPYKRYSSGSHTTHGGTSGTARTPTSGGTYNDVSVTLVNYTTCSSTPRSKARANLMDQDLLITLVCTGAAVLLAVLVAVCCCCCRQNRHRKSGSPSLADNYSETADSVTFNALKSSEASEYATPSDALGGGGPKTARPRSSLIEGEYDVLQQGNAQTDKPKRKVAIVNAYNHVIIVPPNQDRASGSKECENEYDVSTLHKQTNIVVDPEKGSGNVYGHVDIR